MPEFPSSIDDWKRCASEDPHAAASILRQRFDALDPSLSRSAFSHTLGHEELLRAFRAARLHRDRPLAGVPYLLKDLFDFPGIPTLAASVFLDEVRPTPTEESAVSKSARAAGCVFAGKTQLNEFAYGLSGENPHYGDCPHPVFPDRLSGGSSSGSAWAVKRGIVPIAFGTDTGGSVRVPAAWCGLYGLRLAPNSWSRNGCMPLAPSFDTAGWFCSTAADMKLAIAALLQLQDSERPVLRGLNLIDRCHELPDTLANALEPTCEVLQAERNHALGTRFERARTDIVKSYAVLQSIDAFEIHRGWLDNYRDQYDPVVWKRLDRARHWTDDEIRAARRGETEIVSFFAEAFQRYDFILLPATHSPAISAQAHTDTFRSELLALNAPGSFARCPALTIPVELASGETIGIQALYRDERSTLPLDLLDTLSQ